MLEFVQDLIDSIFFMDLIFNLAQLGGIIGYDS